MLVGRKIMGTVGFLGGVWAVPTQFAWAWGQLVQYNEEFLADSKKYIHYDHILYSDHAPARNALAQRFYGDWLLQLDTDHEFEPDILARMLRLSEDTNVDVVCGLYRYKNSPYTPVYHIIDDNDKRAAISSFVDPIPDLLEIGGGGAGCLLVKRKVFDAIYQTGEEPFDRIKQCSEDQSFFVRIKKLGIKAYLAPKIESWHLIATKVTSDYQQNNFGSQEPCMVGGFSNG